jgi:hypothetical protein
MVPLPRQAGPRGAACETVACLALRAGRVCVTGLAPIATTRVDRYLYPVRVTYWGIPPRAMASRRYAGIAWPSWGGVSRSGTSEQGRNTPTGRSEPGRRVGFRAPMHGFPLRLLDPMPALRYTFTDHAATAPLLPVRACAGLPESRSDQNRVFLAQSLPCLPVLRCWLGNARRTQVLAGALWEAGMMIVLAPVRTGMRMWVVRGWPGAQARRQAWIVLDGRRPEGRRCGEAE